MNRKNNLALENKSFIDKTEFLKAEISELETANSDLQSYQCFKSENRDLKETILMIEKNEEKIYNDLDKADLNLKLQGKNVMNGTTPSVIKHI